MLTANPKFISTLNIHHKFISHWSNFLTSLWIKIHSVEHKIRLHTNECWTLWQHEFIQFTMNGNKNVFCGLAMIFYIYKCCYLFVFLFNMLAYIKIKKELNLCTKRRNLRLLDLMRCEIRIAFPCNSSSYQVIQDSLLQFWHIHFMYLLILKFHTREWLKETTKSFVVAFSIFVEQKTRNCDRSLNQRASSISYIYVSYRTALFKQTQDPSETCGVREREKKLGNWYYFMFITSSFSTQYARGISLQFTELSYLVDFKFLFLLIIYREHEWEKQCNSLYLAALKIPAMPPYSFDRKLNIKNEKSCVEVN